MVPLHNQSETIEEERESSSAFLDKAHCIHAGMEVREGGH